MRSSQKGMLQAAKWATFSNIVSQLLVTAVTFILAALLNPGQFGTVAMAYLYITFIQKITGFGFNTALIQRSDLQKKHLDSVFWLTIGSGVFFAIVAILLSGWWSRLNHMSDLQPMVVVLSAIVPIEGLSVVQVALLQRKMHFKHLAVRDNLATAVGGIAGVGMAFCGFGAWALVFQHIVRELTSVIALWRISDWRPGFKFKCSAIKDLGNYSVKTLVGRIGTYAQNSTDSLLMGIFFGPVVLGLYRLANRLIEMTLMIVPRAMQIVSLPHFSKFQSDLPELNKNFLFGTHLNCIIAIPAISYLAGASYIILPVIGPQWTEAIKVLQILAVIGIVKSILLLTGTLLQAVSKPGTYSVNVWVWAILNALAVILATLFFSHGTRQQQLISVALFRVVLFITIIVPLFLFQIRQATKLSFIELLKSIWPAVIVGILIFSSQWLCHVMGIWANFRSKYFMLGASLMLGAIFWLCGVFIFDEKVWQFMVKAVTKVCRFSRSCHIKKSDLSA